MRYQPFSWLNQKWLKDITVEIMKVKFIFFIAFVSYIFPCTISLGEIYESKMYLLGREIERELDFKNLKMVKVWKMQP